MRIALDSFRRLGLRQCRVPPRDLGTRLLLGHFLSGLDHREGLCQQFLILDQPLELGSARGRVPGAELGLVAARFVLLAECPNLLEELSAGLIENRLPVGLPRLEFRVQGGQPLVGFQTLGLDELALSFSIDLAGPDLFGQRTVFRRCGLLEPLRLAPAPGGAGGGPDAHAEPRFEQTRPLHGRRQSRFECAKLLLQLRTRGRQPAVFRRCSLLAPFGQLERVPEVNQSPPARAGPHPEPFRPLHGRRSGPFREQRSCCRSSAAVANDPWFSTTAACSRRSASSRVCRR